MQNPNIEISYKEKPDVLTSAMRGTSHFMLEKGIPITALLTGGCFGLLLRDERKQRRLYKPIEMHEEEEILTAMHEAAHAVARIKLHSLYELGKVTIKPDEGYLGAVFNLPFKKYRSTTKSRVENELVMGLAGRAMEKLHNGGDYSSGAESDMAKVKWYAQDMVTKWGMSDLGAEYFGYGLFDTHSSNMLEKLEQQVSKIIQKAERDADAFVQQHKVHIEKLAGALIDKKTMESEEVIALVNSVDQEIAAPIPQA